MRSSECSAPGARPSRPSPAARPGATGREPASTRGTAPTPRPRRWRPWPSPASGRSAPDLAAACDWLLAHRQGTGWQPSKAKGPAPAALAKFHGSARSAEDRYRLIVTVNDHEIYRADVVGSTEGKAIRVPNRFVEAAANNRVKFDIEGRGQFGYAVTLTGFTREFGPDQDRANKSFGIHRRVYWADTPTLDGRPLAAGFTAASRPQTFENTVTQAALGGKVPISVEALARPARRPAVVGAGFPGPDGVPPRRHHPRRGLRQFPGQPLHGRGRRPHPLFHARPAAGRRVRGLRLSARGLPRLPPSLSSAYEPGRRHLGDPGGLKVLASGEKSTDPYRPTPDEQYARGKALYDAGRLAEAAPHLKALWGGYALRDDIAKDAARMLLTIAIKDYNPKDVIVYFEVLKEKDPDRVISFDDIKVVGRAYGDLGEHERAFLVWRATTDASYLEDARVGEVLRQRGKVLDGIAYLLDLWREYPSTESIQSDFFGLAQVVAGLAGGRRPTRRSAASSPPPEPPGRTCSCRRSGSTRRSSRSPPRIPWPTRPAWRSSARSSTWRTSPPS